MEHVQIAGILMKLKASGPQTPRKMREKTQMAISVLSSPCVAWLGWLFWPCGAARPLCLGAQVVFGVSTFRSVRGLPPGPMINSIHTTVLCPQQELLQRRELVVLDQHPYVLSCLKQQF